MSIKKYSPALSELSYTLNILQDLFSQLIWYAHAYSQ